MKDVSIVIVNYNTKDFLISCLSSIKKNISNTLSYEVIVVDNNSSDDSVDSVKKMNNQPDGLKIIVNEENFGFSKANNIGLKKTNGRYVLFLNADTLIKNNVIGRMFDFMESKKDVGAATCILRMPNGKIDDATHRGFPTPWNAFTHFSGLSNIFPKSMFFNGYNLGWKNMDSVHEIEALAGAFMFVRKEAGDDAGWWDEDYFFYGEDVDFCYMLKQKGWKIYFLPDIEITHFKGVSGGIKKESQHLTKATEETKLAVTNSRFNAMKIFYKKHYENKYPMIVTLLVFFAINLKMKHSLRKM